MKRGTRSALPFTDTAQEETYRKRFMPLLAGMAAFLPCLLVSESKGSSRPLNFEFENSISNDDFVTLMRPFLAVTRFTFLHSAAPLGVTGFDIGVGVSGVSLPDSTMTIAKSTLREGNDLNETLIAPRLNIQKGLPFDIDLGATAIMPLGGDLIAAGAALQWTVINSPSPAPNMALRVAHTMWFGTKSVQAQTTLAEGILSLGLPPGINVLVPYAGGGMMWTAAKASGEWTNPETQDSGALDASFSEQMPYALLGSQIAMLPGFWLTVEAQLAKTQRSYAAKIALAL